MTMNKLIVVGSMPNSRWGGCTREQDFVIDPQGISKAIPATYWKHPFKIMETIYEDNLQGEGD